MWPHIDTFVKMLYGLLLDPLLELARLIDVILYLKILLKLDFELKTLVKVRCMYIMSPTL